MGPEYTCVTRERERDLPLLPWTKKALHSVWQPLRYLLWKKRDKMGITWVVCIHQATPKRLGVAGILNLSMHMMAHGFSILQDMCSRPQQWKSIVQYYGEHGFHTWEDND